MQQRETVNDNGFWVHNAMEYCVKQRHILIYGIMHQKIASLTVHLLNVLSLTVTKESREILIMYLRMLLAPLLMQSITACTYSNDTGLGILLGLAQLDPIIAARSPQLLAKVQLKCGSKKKKRKAKVGKRVLLHTFSNTMTHLCLSSHTRFRDFEIRN